MIKIAIEENFSFSVSCAILFGAWDTVFIWQESVFYYIIEKNVS